MFYESPFAAIQAIFAIDDFQKYLGQDIQIKFRKRVVIHLLKIVSYQFEESFFLRLRNQVHFPEFPHYPSESHPQNPYFSYSILSCIDSQLTDDLDKLGIDFSIILGFTRNFLITSEWALLGCIFDFCISVLNVGHDKKKWQVLQDLIQHCGFIFQFEKVCICCNRPCKLSFDTNNLLHGEEEAAIKFRDGYSVYAFHGKHPSDEY